jgi:hypothetical protein
MRPVGLACDTQHAPFLETMQGGAFVAGTNSGPSSSGSDSPVALLSSCARRQLAGEVTAIPASLALFLHEILGERAVMRETVKKAAPAFRRFRDEF